MTNSVNANDPRVKRTRQLLLQAFTTLLYEEKQNIHSISVQEIAARATLNRATFYAHFEDKYALLGCWMREKFRRTLESQLPASSTLQVKTLRALILAMFDFLALVRSYIRPANRQFEPLFEVALQQELYEILLTWIKDFKASPPLRQDTVETTALIISWTIFGPAMQWSRGERASSAEEMVRQVLPVVIAGLSPVIGPLTEADN
jgi:AcrR family transcriptional regulator